MIFHNEKVPVVKTICWIILPPAIRLAMSDFLKQSDRDLINRKTEELYLSKRNAGDEDLILGVLIPCMIGEEP